MRTFAFCLASALLLPSAVSASVPKPWLGLTGSWATYSMTDVNQDIGAINAALADSGLALRMDEINNGLGFGVAAGLDFPGGFTLGLAYERLSASTDVSDATGGIGYQLPANAFSLRGQYRLPSPGMGAFSLGVGVGWVSEAGALEVSDADFGAFAFDLEGSGLLIEPFVSGDWWVAPQIALSGSAGYRYAKVSEVQVFNQTIYNPDGSKYTVDYSGLLLRAGLKLALTR